MGILQRKYLLQILLSHMWRVVKTMKLKRGWMYWILKPSFSHQIFPKGSFLRKWHFQRKIGWFYIFFRNFGNGQLIMMAELAGKYINNTTRIPTQNCPALHAPPSHAAPTRLFCFCLDFGFCTSAVNANFTSLCFI